MPSAEGTQHEGGSDALPCQKVSQCDVPVRLTMSSLLLVKGENLGLTRGREHVQSHHCC